jgi:hypothetical protein
VLSQGLGVWDEEVSGLRVLCQHQGWSADTVISCVVLCRVHYTPKLREHDVGVLTLGQFMLDIPPGKFHDHHVAACQDAKFQTASCDRIQYWRSITVTGLPQQG